MSHRSDVTQVASATRCPVGAACGRPPASAADNTRSRRGAALLEAMVALAILSSAGISTVAVVGATLRQAQELRQREATLTTAERVLSAMTLLTRADLDRRLGDREIGEFVVNVQRPEPTLYRIAVAEQARPATELLVTVVYRETSK